MDEDIVRSIWRQIENKWKRFIRNNQDVFNVWICSLMYPIYGNIDIKTRLTAGISYE